MLPSVGFDQRPLLFKQGLSLKNGMTPTVPSTDMNIEEVRTLFVSGLPMDVRLRELYLLFRCYEGYEGSFLKLISSKPGKPPQPIAFVSFKSRSLAERALDELQGVKFDPASSQTLRLEFARTNSRVSPKQQQTQVLQQQQQQQPHLTAPPVQPPLVMPPQPNPPVYFQTFPAGVNKDGMYTFYYLPSSPTALAAMSAQNNVQAASNQAQQNLFGMADNSGWSHRMLPLNYHQSLSHVSTPSPTLSPAPSTPHLSVLNILSDSDSSVYNSPSHTPTQALDNSNYCYYSMPASSPIPSDQIGMSRQPLSFTASGSPPCSTLFVANLEPHSTEEEIMQLFGSCPGFIKSKLFTRGGPPVAFVEFTDVEYAAEAMDTLQGQILPSSKRTSGIRIEYARQRMGEPQSKSPIPQDDSSNNSSPIQSITNSTANISINHSSPNSSGVTPEIISSLSSSIPKDMGVLGDPAHIQLPAPPFHLNLQGQVPISVPTMKPESYSQQNHPSLSLPLFPNQQGMEPIPPTFSLPRQSPVQNISSLVTQNLSASAGGPPQRPEYGPFPASLNNRVMFAGQGIQGYGGMPRYSGSMMHPGNLAVNPHGQVYVNGYVQGMPHTWPYKTGFQPQMQ